MYLTWIFRILLWLLAVLFGPIGYLIARTTGLLESVYGNSVDGWGGDAPYKAKEAKVWFRKPWPDFWWSVVRNPANNLARSLTATGEATNVKHTKHFHTATIDGEKLWFLYTPDWPVMLKLGYKIWPSVSEGDKLTAKLAFSMQKGHNK